MPPPRMLHWLMALSFTGAYITADGERWRLVHVTLGYTLAGLLVARVLWGGCSAPGRCACPCCGASCRVARLVAVAGRRCARHRH